MTTPNTRPAAATTLNTIAGYLSFITTAAATTPTSALHAQQLFIDINAARSRIVTLVNNYAMAAEAELIAAETAIASGPAGNT